MSILKVGDGPFIGSNVEIIHQLFDRQVEQNIHGGYNIIENKWVSFIYLGIQLPDGRWTLPPNAPVNNWFNKPNSDNTEFIRECYEENLKKLFTDFKAEYAIFSKTSSNESYFYGVFKLKEQEGNYTKCTFKRISTELNCEDWE
jgi:hypothetical protein